MSNFCRTDYSQSKSEKFIMKKQTQIPIGANFFFQFVNKYKANSSEYFI